MLTGKYPLRFDIREHFHGKGEYLPVSTTLPKLLQDSGYSTAHIGKWHLGGLRVADFAMRDRSPGPIQHGFQHYLTQREEQPLRGNMLKKRNLYREGRTCLLQDDQLVGPESPYYNAYLTDIFGDEAIRQIKMCHDAGQPFFINLWWLTPHTPYEPAPEPHWSQTAAKGISEDQHRFRSMVARMDYQVGRILDTLVELKIADNTLVLFLSDNYITPGSPWENGHIESFHDKHRDECLNREIFGTLREARVILESWRVEYNDLRPHSSLGYLSPSEYKQRNQSDGGLHAPKPRAARRGRRSGGNRVLTHHGGK